MRVSRPRNAWNWRREIGWPLLGLAALALIVWFAWPSDVDVEANNPHEVVDRAIELKRERLIESGYSEQEANRIIRQDESLEDRGG